AIGLSVYLRGGIQRSLRRFLILCLSVCLWHVATAVYAPAGLKASYWQKAWAVIPLLVALWVPSASLRFFAAFLRGERPTVPRAASVLNVLAVCLTIVIVAPLFLPDVDRLRWQRVVEAVVGAYVFTGLCCSI